MKVHPVLRWLPLMHEKEKEATLPEALLLAFNHAVGVERAKFARDRKMLDWLEQQGLIGIGHIAHGDYKLYAGSSPFPSLREVCELAMLTEREIKAKETEK